MCHWWSGSPLFYAGMNPLALYVGHELCHGYFPFAWHPLTETHAEILYMNASGAAMWMLVAAGLYHAGIFVSL